MNYHIIQIDDSRIDNIKKIESVLNGNRLKIKTFDGHRHSIRSKIYSENVDLKISNKLNFGEIGCFASHLESWKYIIENNLDNVLILEDDAMLENNFVEKLQYSMHHIPKDYDIFFAFVSHEMHKYFDFNKHYIGNDFVCKAFQDWSTLCYLISNSGAKNIMSLVKEQGMISPVDNFILENHEAGRIKAYAPKINNLLPIQICQKYESKVQL